MIVVREDHKMNDTDESLVGIEILLIKPLDNFKLWIKFNTLEEKIFDAKPLIKELELKAFENPLFFYNAKTLDQGVCWEGEFHITVQYLYLNEC